MYSLFLGRWQPFHKGHKKLIDKVLEEGKSVVVAIRDTEISESNPFTVDERKKMIRGVYGSKVRVITIPDITEVCYGRKVGWKVRKIRLDKQSEEVSATSIRNSAKRVIWFTGNMGSGKSSLAYLLQERLNAIILDGDEMRKSISTQATFSREDRNEHNLRVARLAAVLHNQGHNVIVSVIAPFQKTRDKIAQICDPYWIYIKGGEKGKDKPYEAPSKPDITIDPSTESLLESMETIVKTVGGLNNKST